MPRKKRMDMFIIVLVNSTPRDANGSVVQIEGLVEPFSRVEKDISFLYNRVITFSEGKAAIMYGVMDRPAKDTLKTSKAVYTRRGQERKGH